MDAHQATAICDALDSMAQRTAQKSEQVLELYRMAKSNPKANPQEKLLGVSLHLLLWSLDFAHLLRACIAYDENRNLFARIFATHLYDMCESLVPKITGRDLKNAIAGLAREVEINDSLKKVMIPIHQFREQKMDLVKTHRHHTFAHRAVDPLEMLTHMHSIDSKAVTLAAVEYLNLIFPLIALVTEEAVEPANFPV